MDRNILLLISINLLIINDGVGASSDGIHCLFLKNYEDSCRKNGDNSFPNNALSMALINLPENVKTIITSNETDWNLTQSEIMLIPPQVWLLMRVERLSHLSGKTLTDVILAYPDDTNIASQLTSALNLAQGSEIYFILLSSNDRFVDNVKHVLAEAACKIYPTKPNIGKLLAYLPPYNLFTKSSTVIEHHLFHLLSLEYFNIDWLKKPKQIQRIWSYLYYTYFHMKIKDWSDIHINKLWYTLPGMTIEQLSDLKYIKNLSNISIKRLLQLDFEKLQTQMLFDLYYIKNHKQGFKDLSHILTKLSPSQLLQFPINMTGFSTESFLETFDDDIDYNFATVKQITQMLIAELKFNGSWDSSVKHLGRFVYTLDLQELISLQNNTVDASILVAIESKKLSFAQVYYLTGRGTMLQINKVTTLKSMTWMLKGVPASNIRNFDIYQYSSFVVFRLLRTLPGDNTPKMVAFLGKITQLLNFNGIMVMENLLLNPSMEEYFKLIPSSYLKKIMIPVNENLKDVEAHKIKHLPNRALSLLLKESFINSWIWNSSMNGAVTLQHFIRGLTCDIVEQMETSEFIYVMGLYNKERVHLGNTFPKNLQYCCYEKLVQYLKFKSELAQGDQEDGLLSFLEPGDIEAVGGYVLSSIPAYTLSISKYKSQILMSIGKLSLPELLLAVNEFSRDELVRLSFNEFRPGNEMGNNEFFHMRNLVLFLPRGSVSNINPSTLKLVLEQDFIDKRLCIDKRTRSAWSDVIKKAFGEPETWTEGVIISLGDFLLVIDDGDLRKIKKSSWLKVGGLPALRFNDMVEWWTEDEIPFYKACKEVLKDIQNRAKRTNQTHDEENAYMDEIKKLVKWQVQSAQWQLDTVKNADDILNNFRRSQSSEKTYLPNFSRTFFNSDENITTSTPGTKDVTLPTTVTVDNSTGDYPVTVVTNVIVDVITSNANNFSISVVPTSANEDLKNVSDLHDFKTESNMFTSTVASVSDGDDSTLAVSDNNIVITDIPVTSTRDYVNENNYKKRQINEIEDQNYFVNSSINNSNFSDVIANDKKDISVETSFEQEFLHQRSDTNNKPIPQSRHSINTIHINSSKLIQNSSMKVYNYLNKVAVESRAALHSSQTFNNSYDNKINKSYGNNNNNEILNNIQNCSTENTKLLDDRFQEDTVNSYNEEYYNSRMNDERGSPILLLNTPKNTSEYQNTPENTTDQKSIEDFFREDPVGDYSNEYSETSDERGNPFPLSNTTLNFDNKMINNKEFFDYDISANIFSTELPMYDSDQHLRNVNDYERKVLTKRGINLDKNNSKSELMVMNSELKENELKVTCDALRMVGPIAGLVINDVTIELMNDLEIQNCFEVFAQMDLIKSMKIMLWERLKHMDLHLLGSLLELVQLNDLNNISFNFNDPWILETVYYTTKNKLDTSTSNGLVEKILADNMIDKIGQEGLAAMSNIICDIKSINRKLLLSKSTEKDQSIAVSSLGKVDSCSMECLTDLAEFVIGKTHYGSPSNWDSHDTSMLGVIPAGLSKTNWTALLSNKNALMGLQSSAMKCLTQEYLLEIPSESFRRIPIKSLNVMYKEHYQELKEDQKFALTRIMSLQLNNITRSLHPVVRTKELPTPTNNAVKTVICNYIFLTILATIITGLF